MKVNYPIPAFLPDQSDNSGTLVELKNAYPTADGYKPIKGFQPISVALPADFKGGASFVTTDGTSYLVVGTSTGLVRYAAGSWTNLVTGLTVTDQWRFSAFGNFAVAVNGTDTIEIDLNAGTASTLTNAPIGKSIAIIDPYLVIGQDSSDLLSVFTSDVNDHTRWVPDAGATQQPQLTGDEVMGIGGGEYGVILQRRRLVRMSKTGDATLPFDYDPITENVGCASKGSVAQHGRSIFFLADQGFASIEDGQAVQFIGSEQVDRTFQEMVPAAEYERIYSAVDPVKKLVIWCVPGSPGRLWIFNYELRKWGVAELNIEGVFAGFTSSATLEQVSADNPDLDAMTVSLDDPQFSGGNPQLYAVQGGKIGALSGENLEAIFQLGFAELSKGKIARIRSIRTVTDCVEGQTVKVDARDRMGDPASVKTAGSIRASGIMPVRARGRFMKFRHEIAAGADWSYLQAIEIEFETGGER